MNTIIIIFNVCDTIGRNLPNFIKFTVKSFAIISFLRVIFVFIFPFAIALFKADIASDNTISTLVTISLILFSISNGLACSLSFGMSPQNVPDDLKGKAGGTISFSLICGIFCGSMFALVFMKQFTE